jgi:hypothetical protein
MAFRAEATRLQNAGAQLPYADRQLLESMNRTLPGTPVDDAMLHGGLSPAAARTQVQGNKLLAAGRSLAEVREIIGDPKFEGDSRTAAQREHDRQHNVPPSVDRRSYTVPVPPGESATTWQAVDADARELAGSLNLTPEAGSAFIRTVVGAANELAADQGMTRQKWEHQLAQVFPGTRLTEAETRIDAMLRDVKSPMAAKLRDRGLLRHPELFVRLNNRALSLAAWRRARPQ